jgi:dienelactone hydrolase
VRIGFDSTADARDCQNEPWNQTRGIAAMKESVPKRSRRRWLPPVIAVAVVVAAACLWLFDHLRSQEAQFIRRRGKVASVQVTPGDAPGGAFLSAAVRITADTGLSVDLRVLRPAQSSQPLPLVLLLGGHRTGRDAVDLVGDPGPMVVAALDYPYQGPDKPRGWQIVSSIPAIQRGLLDTPPAVSLALDWLIEQPWVDRTRVELVGVSLGVPFAAVAGALDPRFRRVWLIHGAADNRGLFEHNLRSRIAHGWLRAGAADLLYLLAYGPTFEPARWVPRIAPRSVVVIGATDDERLPREKVERLYAAAGEPKELLWTQGRHIEPSRPEILRQLLDTVRTRVLQPSDPASTPEVPGGAGPG